MKALLTLSAFVLVAVGTVTKGHAFGMEEVIKYGRVLTSMTRSDGDRPSTTNPSGTRGYGILASLRGFGACPENFPNGGLDTSFLSKGRELCFDGFAVLYDPKRFAPAVAIEHLTRERLIAAKSIKRTNRFYEEARIPLSERALLSDFKGSGCDKGHNAPAADMHNDQAMAQSFSLANIVCQDPQSNQGIWGEIESSTRKYVMRTGADVFVFTGPAYQTPNGMVKNKIPVPSHMWKVVYDQSQQRAWALWVENSAQRQRNVRISYEDFLRRGGPDVLRASKVTTAGL